MIPDTLNLQGIPPQQGMDKHPCGLFPFNITTTRLQETKDRTGAMLVIEFTTPVGRIEKFYNVSNPSPQAVEIANKELSALGHAINIYNVAFPKDNTGAPIMEKAGHNLIGGQGKLEVAFQKGHEPTAEKPSGGYVEVRKVFDINGNEPGKATAQPQPQQQGNGQAAWSAGPTTQQQPQAQPAANSGWAQPNNPSPNAAAQPQQPNPAPAGNKPSWA